MDRKRIEGTFSRSEEQRSYINGYHIASLLTKIVNLTVIVPIYWNIFFHHWEVAHKSSYYTIKQPHLPMPGLTAYTFLLRNWVRGVQQSKMKAGINTCSSNFLICISKLMDIFKTQRTMATVKRVGNPNRPPASSQESQPCNRALIWQTATLWSHETELITISCPFYLHQWVPSIQNWMTFHFCVTMRKSLPCPPLFGEEQIAFGSAQMQSRSYENVRICILLVRLSNLSPFSKRL